MWDKSAIECIEEAVGKVPITCKFKSFSDQFEWAFPGVYGPNADFERHFWQEELSGWLEIPWCIRRDFNVTHFPNERFGVTQITFAMREFLEFISGQELMDIPLAGGSFTWSNNQGPPSMSMIDRFLVSLEWEEHLLDMI